MDNINFSNDLFRRMVQAFKPQPINEVEDVQEAVPFKKHAFGEMKLKDTDIKLKEEALNEVDPSNLTVGKEYVYIGGAPGTGEPGRIYMKYKGIAKDIKGTTYHLFDDGKGTSGVFADNDVMSRFRSPEESMRSEFDMWRSSLEEVDFDVNDDLKTMSDLGL